MKNIYESYNFKNQPNEKSNIIMYDNNNNNKSNYDYIEVNEKFDPRNPEHRIKFTISKLFKK